MTTKWQNKSKDNNQNDTNIHKKGKNNNIDKEKNNKKNKKNNKKNYYKNVAAVAIATKQ